MSENFSIFLCIFPLVSIGILGVGVWLAIKTRRFQTIALEAPATIIGKENIVSPTEQKGTNYANFQFVTHTGEVVTGRSIIGVPWAGKNKGKEVTILYNPDNPKESRVNSFVELHAPALIFMLVGIGQFITFSVIFIVQLFA